MAEFRVGVEHRTKEPRIEVDAGLKPGPHEFALVVVNDRGEISAPDPRVVTILVAR
jgi:hypothetical protein